MRYLLVVYIFFTVIQGRAQNSISSNFGFKNGDAGTLYKIIETKGGSTLKVGDFACLNVVVKTEADSTLFSTYDAGQPSFMIVNKGQKKSDVISALKYLADGDSAIIKTNIDSNLTEVVSRPQYKGNYINYFIRVEKAISKGNLSDSAFREQIETFIKAKSEKSRVQEPLIIKKYVADNNLKLTTTASGLQYVITNKVVGKKAILGDTILIYYTGKFLDGKIFDSNIKADLQKAKMPLNPVNPYKPLKFALGSSGMIKGWNEAVTLLGKGEKAMFILPSKLAYGDQGFQKIPGFTPLFFDIELVDIIHPTKFSLKKKSTKKNSHQFKK